MKRLIYFLLVLIVFNVQCSMFNELKAQRSCGLWLNEVPLVADTAANSIFATIEPRFDCSLKGTLRWDESLYSSVSLNDTPLENGKRGNLELADWKVDFVFTHCTASDIAVLLGGFHENDRLTSYFQDIRLKLEYKRWFFGHYHMDRAVTPSNICLFEQIVQIN